MFMVVLSTEHGIYYNHWIPKRIGQWQAGVQFTDSNTYRTSIEEVDIVSHDIKDEWKINKWAEDFGLNEQQKTVWLEERKVPPQYVVNFKDAYLRGSDFI